MDNIELLDRIITWPLPKSSPVNIKIGDVEWSWVFQFNDWLITCGTTIYDRLGWEDYIKNKEDEKRAMTSIEDAQAPHIFDVISYWPESGAPHPGTKDLPEGWMWQWVGDNWVLSNGTIGLVRDDWFKHRNKMAPVHVLHLIGEWPKAMPPQCELELIKNCEWKYVHGEWVLFDKFSDREFHEGHWLNYHENLKKYAQPLIPTTREEVMALVDVWPTDWNKSGEKLTDDWIWAVLGGSPVIINQTDNVNSGTVITESEWLEYLVQVLRKNPAIETVTAASMLQAALGHMEDRAKTYDAPGGERSMGKTVSAFNTITGLTLSEEQGWLFMEILKQVRSQQGNYRADNYEDMVAYAALRGECAARERGDK